MIRTKDGRQFSFRKADWFESRAPRRNDRVDFQAEGDKAAGVYFFQESDRSARPSKPASAPNSALDLGLIAAGYAIVLFASAIFDAFFNVIGLDPGDIIALFVILDILVAAAWMFGSNFRLMRWIATIFATAVTALALVFLAKHAINGPL